MRVVAILTLAAVLVWFAVCLAEWIHYRRFRITIWRYYETR